MKNLKMILDAIIITAMLVVAGIIASIMNLLGK